MEGFLWKAMGDENCRLSIAAISHVNDRYAQMLFTSFLDERWLLCGSAVGAAQLRELSVEFLISHLVLFSPSLP